MTQPNCQRSQRQDLALTRAGATGLFLGMAFLVMASPVAAHHGIAGLGAAAYEGPGAAIETASATPLPAGHSLVSIKLDQARFKTYDSDPQAPEARRSDFLMLGFGYGFTPWFSAYLFAPHHHKRDEAGGFDTRGWADVSLLGQFGFKFEPGEGLRLLPASESLDDLEDWHFTLYGGSSLPTGRANLRDATGQIDPGKATGFGRPAWQLGLTASKMLNSQLTLNLEAATQRFGEYTYADQNRWRFGNETRLNAALNWRLPADSRRQGRLDAVLEAQLLHLGRDLAAGTGTEATGGTILYLLPGLRYTVDKLSFAAGIKRAAWTRLNEAAQQQGAEGKERYRLLLSASMLF